MRRLLRWIRRHTDTTDEARDALARAEQLDAEVARLGVGLAEIEAHNHFSAMVRVAIARTRDG